MFLFNWDGQKTPDIGHDWWCFQIFFIFTPIWETTNQKWFATQISGVQTFPVKYCLKDPWNKCYIYLLIF